jgi:serine/threonine protein kinase
MSRKRKETLPLTPRSASKQKSTESIRDLFDWYQGIGYEPFGYTPKTYSTKHKKLLLEIATFVKKIKDTCHRSALPQHPTFNDMLCYFLSEYSPKPRDFEKKSQLLLERIRVRSEAGRLFKNKVADQPFLVKVPLEDTEDTVSELYVNMIIVNRILLNPTLRDFHPMFVPSYGIYVCATNIDDEFNTDTELQTCVGDLNGKPTLFLIQHYIEKQTSLLDLLLHERISLKRLQYYAIHVFSTMATLQASCLRLCHNDLHGNNILITPEHKVVFIDWGLASFNSKDDHHAYPYLPNVDQHLSTALFDAIQFITTLRTVLENGFLYKQRSKHSEEIYSYLTRALSMLQYEFPTIPIRSMDDLIDRRESFTKEDIQHMNQFNYFDVMDILELDLPDEKQFDTYVSDVNATFPEFAPSFTVYRRPVPSARRDALRALRASQPVSATSVMSSVALGGAIGAWFGPVGAMAGATVGAAAPHLYQFARYSSGYGKKGRKSKGRKSKGRKSKGRKSKGRKSKGKQ